MSALDQQRDLLGVVTGELAELCHALDRRAIHRQHHVARLNTGVGRRGIKFLDGGKQVLVENLAIVNNGIFTKVS